MNGLLTALLGGASGVGEGLKYQDEKARAAAQLKLQQEAGQRERDRLAMEAALQGLVDETPPPNSVAPQGRPSAPSAPQLVPAPYMPSTYGEAGPRQMVPAGPSASPPLALPGGASAVDAMRAAVDARGGPSNPSMPQFGGLPAAMNRTVTVDLPSLGGRKTFDFANSQLGRQMMLKQYEIQQQVEADIYKAYATGQMRKADAEARLAELHADPNFIRTEAAAQAQGRYGSEANLENLRFGHQQQLQSNQQQFTAGQNAAQRTFEAGQTGVRLAGEHVNRSADIYQQQGNGAWSRLLRQDPATTAPSTSFTQPAQALEQQRADWDAAAASLRMQKKSEGYITEHLGARP